MERVIVMRLYLSDEVDPIPAEQALLENVMPAIEQLGKHSIHVNTDRTRLVARERETGNTIYFTIERTVD